MSLWWDFSCLCFLVPSVTSDCTDIGDGSVETGSASLSRIPLRWMVRECFRANTGILFLSHTLSGIGLDPKTLFPHVLPRPPPLSTIHQESTAYTMAGPSRIEEPAVKENPPLSEEVIERSDALSPIHDKLKSRRIWWILELMPFRRWFQSEDSDEKASSGFV